MPKIKTCRAAAKRFKKTGTGKLVRNKAYKSHILTKKSQKRKRNLRKSTVVDSTNVKSIGNTSSQTVVSDAQIRSSISIHLYFLKYGTKRFIR